MNLLKSIIKEAEKARAAGRPLKAIFDLDSTLYDVSPRITEIFHAFARSPDMRARYPKETELLSRIRPASTDFGVKRTLLRNGLTMEQTTEDFIRLLVHYWKSKFFSNEFLEFDCPYPGAVKYVNDLERAGAEIFYLTGRDVPRMKDGSIASLKKNRFPLANDAANLLLKPTTEEKDTAFKKRFFMAMENSGCPVYFFENEPANIHLVMENSPHVTIVYVETVHSQSTPEPAAQVLRIQNFSQD